MGKRPLTPKQARFVDEYLTDLNATQAAIRAGYSTKTARQIGSRLLTNVDIQTALQQAFKARARRTEVTSENVLEELAAIGFSRLDDFADWDGKKLTLRDSKSIDPRAMGAVSQVVSRPTIFGDAVGIKLHPKLPALRYLGQHLGLFGTGGNAAPRGGFAGEQRFGKLPQIPLILIQQLFIEGRKGLAAVDGEGAESVKRIDRTIESFEQKDPT